MTSWNPHGTAYGTLLNFQNEYALWQPRMTQEPYKAAPKAPVLYIKSANTFCPAGQDLVLPLDVEAVEVGATLGLVMGENSHVNSVVLLNDWSVPHESYFRPPIKYRCRDQFLGLASQPTPWHDALNVLHELTLNVTINDALVQTVELQHLVRDISQLLQDVSEFMTLQQGDVLMVGTEVLASGQRPLARAGDIVSIQAKLNSAQVSSDASKPTPFHLHEVRTSIRSAQP